jgi:hypothetical protein
VTSPDAVLDLIRRNRGPQARLAIVVGVQAGPPMYVAVRFVEGGDLVEPLISEQSSLPAVGAKCILVPAVGGGWVFLGSVTIPQGLFYNEAPISIAENWAKYRSVDTGEWTFQQNRHDFGDFKYTVAQGRWEPQSGAAGQPTPTNPPMTEWVTILNHRMQGLLSVIAMQGGTVEKVELQMRRFDPATDYSSPVMYGHLYTYNNPPIESQPPQWVPGYGPLTLAPFSQGQTARWTLPASWVTAMATGEIAGIGFRYDGTRHRFTSEGVEPEPWRNGVLLVSYSSPTEILV